MYMPTRLAAQILQAQSWPDDKTQNYLYPRKSHGCQNIIPNLSQPNLLLFFYFFLFFLFMSFLF